MAPDEDARAIRTPYALTGCAGTQTADRSTTCRPWTCRYPYQSIRGPVSRAERPNGGGFCARPSRSGDNFVQTCPQHAARAPTRGPGGSPKHKIQLIMIIVWRLDKKACGLVPASYSHRYWPCGAGPPKAARTIKAAASERFHRRCDDRVTKSARGSDAFSPPRTASGLSSLSSHPIKRSAASKNAAHAASAAQAAQASWMAAPRISTLPTVIVSAGGGGHRSVLAAMLHLPAAEESRCLPRCRRYSRG